MQTPTKQLQLEVVCSWLKMLMSNDFSGLERGYLNHRLFQSFQGKILYLMACLNAKIITILRETQNVFQIS